MQRGGGRIRHAGQRDVDRSNQLGGATCTEAQAEQRNPFGEQNYFHRNVLYLTSLKGKDRVSLEQVVSKKRRGFSMRAVLLQVSKM